MTTPEWPCVSVHERITAQIVLTTFRSAYAEHEHPRNTLTDNGMVYTVQFASQKVHGGRTAFEAELARLGLSKERPRHCIRKPKARSNASNKPSEVAPQPAGPA